MGQYKVPQDVEAEDKIIGFLTLKQFIYSVIGVAWGLLTFQLFKSVLFIFVIVGIPPTIIFLLLGLYQRDGQPFESYLIALVNYWFKPRHRVWIKEDLIEVFKIEQPKPKAQEIQRDPREVRGQLEKLAQIVDTRGWAAKNPDLSEPEMTPVIDLSDRLAAPPIIAPQAEAKPEVSVEDDIFDTNNPASQNLNILIENAVKNVHEEAMEIMRQQQPMPHAAVGEVVQPAQAKKSQGPKAEAPQPTIAATDVLETVGTVPPPAPTPQAPPAAPKSAAAASTTEMTTNPITDILKRAMENTDLKVSQVSQIAAHQTTLVEGQSVDVRDGQ